MVQVQAQVKGILGAELAGAGLEGLEGFEGLKGLKGLRG